MATLKTTSQRILSLALMAAVIATFCDGIHVHTGTLSYPDPWLFGQPVRVLPSFFMAFIVMAGGYYMMIKVLPGSIAHNQGISPGSFQDCLEAMIAFALVYLLSGFGNREPLLLSWIFYGTFFIRLAGTYEKLCLLLLALLLAGAGIVGEGALSVWGLVSYRQPEIYHVPFWLGALYMHGAFALRAGMRFFVYR